MSKIYKILTLTLFSTLICFLTYCLCYFIAEKYFFDKFFYQKSVAHGYYPPGAEIQYADFGNRSKDIISLYNHKLTNDPKVYNIAIIGDSHVWGQGIRNNQRFAYLLENKLNKIRPTKVYSFGKGGSNTLNYFRMYERILSSSISINTYIILPVSNDALINVGDKENDVAGANIDNQDDPILQDCQKLFPKQKTSIYPGNKNNPMNKYIPESIGLSWKNPINACVVNESIKRLPSNNAIYLVDKDYLRENPELKEYQRLLSQNNKYQISTEVGKFMDKYKRYFNKNVYQNFNVSLSDPHPNALANQMYTDIIFAEITTNPKWNFQIPHTR